MHIQIQTTTVCNARCILCPYANSWFKKNPNIMDDDTFDLILEKLKDVQIERICPYLMNEPFTDKKIFERIEKIIQTLKFGYLEISTNAGLIDDEKIDKINSIVTKVRNKFVISFHGIDKTSYENLMKLNYDKNLEAIKKLLILSKNKNLNIVLNGCGSPSYSTLNAKTYFRKEEYHSFWESNFKKWGIIKKPTIKYFNYTDRSGSIEDNFNYTRPLNSSLCSRLFNWVHILYNGEITVCCNDYDKEYIIGDIKKDSIKNIMKSDEMNIIKHKYKNYNGRDFICRKCNLL